MKNTRIGATSWLPSQLRLSIAVLVCLTFGAIGPASAKESGQLERYAAEYTAGHLDTDAEPDPLRSGPLFAVVSIADQRISVYGSSGLLARSPVSTGVRGHPTPTGVFSIVQKRRWHESNIYSSAPMPFMQRITWSGIALHAGVVPGHPASHGCIRLPASFAPRLFGATEIGQRVIVAPADTAPVEITHKTLPAPMLSPAPGAAVSGAPDTTASVDTPERSGGALLETVGLHDAPAVAERLNPLEFARAMKIDATSKAKAAGGATRAAMLLIARKTTELRLAARKLASAENAEERATDELAAAVRRLEKTDGKEAIAEAVEAKSEAEAALVEAQQTRDARIAKATEVLTQAEAGLAEVQKAVEEARIARTAENQNEAGPALTEVQNMAEAVLTEAEKAVEDGRMAEAAEARNEAAQALIKTQKAEEARIAKAAEARSEAAEALAKVQKTEEARVAKATEDKSEAETNLLEEQKAEEVRVAKATETRNQAEAALAEMRKAAEVARAAKDAKDQELAAARDAAAEAKAAGKAAMAAIAEATRRLKPLSVFISRKTGRLYVRQNFQPLFDAPVSISDTGRDIGTHLYVSTHAAEDGSALRWQAVSVPVVDAAPSRRGKNRDGDQDEAAASAPLPEPETAQGALDRVTIPEETSVRLAELAWVGAAVIISDHGISGETGATTDFIILTKPRPSTR